MSSKLFHTIVGVGIALGAATSVGCASAAPDETVASEAALAYPDPGTSTPGTDAGPDIDAFCDATWPTTKGAPFRPPPSCVDPTGACREAGRPFECAESTDGQMCTWPTGSFDFYYSVCFQGTWQCKPGKVPTASCTCWQGDPACDPSAPPDPATK